MTQPKPNITLIPTPDYRESYSNSVQIRVNLWDFFIQFGTVHQSKPEEVEIKNFQGIYLSPQQAKALYHVLSQNLSQYENAFGEIKIDPNAVGTGSVQ